MNNRKKSKTRTARFVLKGGQELCVDAATADVETATRVVQAVFSGETTFGPADAAWLGGVFGSYSLSLSNGDAWLRALASNVSLLNEDSAGECVDAALANQAWTTDDNAEKEFRHFVENLVSAHAVRVQPVVNALVAHLRNTIPSTDKKISPALLSSKFDRIHNVLHAVIRLIPSAPSVMHAILADHFPHKSEDARHLMWFAKNLFRIQVYAPVLRNSVWALCVDRATMIDVEIQTALDDLSEEDYNQVLAHCFDIDAAGHDRDSITFMSPKTFASAGRVGTIPDELRLDDDDDCDDSTGATCRDGNKKKGDDDFSSSDDDEGDKNDSENDSDNDSVEATDEEEDDAPPPIVVSDFRKMSGKLDSLLHFLLGQITLVFTQSAPASSIALPTSTSSSSKSRTTSASNINYSDTSDEALEFFSILLQIFERTILPTHQCKYVQFLYFHACSMSSKCTESFLVLLAQKTFDTSSPAIIRCASSAYLSSFVARAKFVEIEAVLYCLKMLNGWALTYVDANEGLMKVGAVLDGGKTHACFYSVIQALLYVFCFRWREIVAAAGVGDGGGAGGDLENGGRSVEYGRLPVEMNGFQRLVQSRFQPLKVCTKSVVAEFARITHKLDMLYCYTHIQQQRPVLTTTTSTNTLLHPPPVALPITSQPIRAIRLNTNTTQANSSNTIYNKQAMAFSSTTTATSSSPELTTPETATTPTMSNQMSYIEESTLLQQAQFQEQQQQRGGVATAAGPATRTEYQYQPQDTIGTACLEAFFPFDPCHLIMSKRVIEEGYNEWLEEEEEDGGENGGYGGVGGVDGEIDFISSSFDAQMSMSAD
ncbi:UNVERIFIED_CONTAM: hypothetical protein HDU68_008413 [Siphonaria sp. JEL0065]|nr:hypothetical protein HDU68_008413 [Siphonaria sp. JEL0065]